MTDKRLLESSYRESPASRPSFSIEVFGPTILLAGAAYVAVSVVYGAALAQFSGAVVCAVVLLWRLYVWDSESRPVHITEHNRYVNTPEETPQIRPATVDHSNHRWRIGKWSFSESEWRRFADALKTGRVTRDLLGDLEKDNGDRMFTNVTARYNEYVAELQRIGWIDDNNAVTDVAWTWLQERGLALPPETSSAENQR